MPELKRSFKIHKKNPNLINLPTKWINVPGQLALSASA